MKFPVSKRNKLLKRANIILFNCEMWGNKEDGIKTKLIRGHFVNCKIRQNVRGAIQIEGKLSEQMIGIYCSASKVQDIKGKIQGDGGLVNVKILVHDDVDELMFELRKEG